MLPPAEPPQITLQGSAFRQARLRLAQNGGKPAAPLHGATSCCTLLILFYAAQGYLFTLRTEWSEREAFAPSAGYWAAHGLLGGASLAAIVTLWLTHLTDPGYLQPRESAPPEVQDVACGRVKGEELGWSRDAFGQWSNASGERFCSSCNIWRPVRAAHCSYCNCCVLRQDHHCGVVGACIGERNHGSFLAFLLSCSAGGALLTAVSSARLLRLRWPWTGESWRLWETYVHLFSLIFNVYLLCIVFIAFINCWMLSTGKVSRDMMNRHRPGFDAASSPKDGHCCASLAAAPGLLGRACCVRPRSRAAAVRRIEEELEREVAAMEQANGGAVAADAAV